MEILQKRNTLIDLLILQAKQQTDWKVYTFLENGEGKGESLTFQELDRQARKIASYLQKNTQVGDRVLLLHLAGFEFITSFWGCLYAGVIGVPLYPPRQHHSLLRVQHIINDCQPTLALTNKSILPRVRTLLESLPENRNIRCIASEEALAEQAETWQRPQIDARSIAYLQYTSGSTSNPKGCIIDHNNILHNLFMLKNAMGLESKVDVVYWLPHFHDMGLVAGILHPVYITLHSILMPPAAFLMQPMRWLYAMSRYKGHASSAPNFAYDLCAKKITEIEKSEIDLSHWKLALCGAETVNAESLSNVAKAFEKTGFQYSSFRPCYGLAESTVFVTGGNPRTEPV